MWQFWKSETRDFLSRLRRSDLLDSAAIRRARKSAPDDAVGESELDKLCSHLVEDRWITPWQCDQLWAGRWKGFFLDNYKLLDKIDEDCGWSGRIYLAVDLDTGLEVGLQIRFVEDGLEYELVDLWLI